MFRRLAAQIDKLRRFNNWHMLARLELQVRISSALSRAAATASLRLVDPLRPLTWELNGFSQHGEDGIIDYLCGHVTTPKISSFSKSARRTAFRTAPRTAFRTAPLGWRLPKGTPACGWKVTRSFARELEWHLRERSGTFT